MPKRVAIVVTELRPRDAFTLSPRGRRIYVAHNRPILARGTAVVRISPCDETLTFTPFRRHDRMAGARCLIGRL